MSLWSKQSVNIGIVGATGEVGQKILQILDERDYPVNDLRVFASPDSAGKQITWRDQEYTLENGSTAGFIGMDIVFLSAGGDATKTQVSRELCPKVALAGAIAIDNSSAWRRKRGVPLVVAEVNPEDLDSIPQGIVANPNCTTMIAAPVLKVLHDAAGLQRVVMSSYQAVSGQGAEGVAELERQSQFLVDESRRLIDGTLPAEDFPAARVFQDVVGFNVLPEAGELLDRIDAIEEGMLTTEEVKFIKESRKILHLSNLAVSATCVRVPVFNGHSLSLEIGLERPLSADAAICLLSNSAGVTYQEVPQPIDASGSDDVLVGRLRKSGVFKHGLSLFVSGDNLRKGAALNAVQIAELLLKK